MMLIINAIANVTSNMVKVRRNKMITTNEEYNSYDCQGNHKRVGNICMKCGARYIDFGDYNEGDGITNGWTQMKGMTIDNRNKEDNKK